MSLEEPEAPGSLPFSSSSLLFSSSSSCRECPGVLRCLQSEYGEVTKERVKIAHAEQVIVACSRLCVSKQLFFHVSLYQKFEAFASGIK